jgi:hypothetical protein
MCNLTKMHNNAVFYNMFYNKQHKNFLQHVFDDVNIFCALIVQQIVR